MMETCYLDGSLKCPKLQEEANGLLNICLNHPADDTKNLNVAYAKATGPNNMETGNAAAGSEDKASTRK